MCNCADDKKKNGIRLTRRTKSIYKGLAYAIATYARVQMPPYYDGLHTGIKNARMRRNRTELAVLCRYVKNLVHRKYANSFLLSKHSCLIFFVFLYINILNFSMKSKYKALIINTIQTLLHVSAYVRACARKNAPSFF